MVRMTVSILAPACLALLVTAGGAQVTAPPAGPVPQAAAAQNPAVKAPPSPTAATQPDASETSSTGGRRTRSYARCNRSAQRLGYRGAERHRHVARCRLGYERPATKP